MNKDELNSIIEVIEKSVSNPIMSSYFVVFEEEDKMKIKMENRSLAVEALIDNKIDEYKGRTILPDDSFSDSYKTMSAKMKEVTIYPNKFRSYQDVRDSYINDILTSPNYDNNFNLHRISNDDLHSFSRKVISRILMASNMVATSGRMGPANYAFVNPKSYTMYNAGSNNAVGMLRSSGMNIIPETLVPDDEIVVIRSHKDVNSIIHDVSNNAYYKVYHPSFLTKMCIRFQVIW